MGSLKGTPNSIISAPPSSMESKIGTVASLVGYPAVTKVPRAGCPFKLSVEHVPMDIFAAYYELTSAFLRLKRSVRASAMVGDRELYKGDDLD